MISVRGSGLAPTTAASAGLGVSAFMNAALGVRFLAGAAVLAAALLAGAFLAVAMFGFSFLGLVNSASENLHVHWQVDANGKKTAFQASRQFFCFGLLLWRHGRGGSVRRGRGWLASCGGGAGAAWRGSVASRLVVDDTAQRIGTEDAHVALLDFDN